MLIETFTTQIIVEWPHGHHTPGRKIAKTNNSTRITARILPKKCESLRIRDPPPIQLSNPEPQQSKQDLQKVPKPQYITRPPLKHLFPAPNHQKTKQPSLNPNGKKVDHCRNLHGLLAYRSLVGDRSKQLACCVMLFGVCNLYIFR